MMDIMDGIDKWRKRRSAAEKEPWEQRFYFWRVSHDSGYGKVQIEDTYRREVKTREFINGKEYTEGGTYGSALHKEGVAHGGDLHMERARGPHRGGVETKGGAQRWKIIIKGGGCNTKRGIHGRYR